VTAGELWLRAASAVGLMALVLLGLQYLLRLVRAGRWPRVGRRLAQVLETVPLSHAAALHVVRIGDRFFAVAAGQSSLALVCEVPAESIDAWQRSR
jgi:hypothetical protein